jgi:hypothetical protein
MKGFLSFYSLFYGFDYARHFRRPPDFAPSNKIKMQFTVLNPKQLYLQVHRNSGIHPCFTHIYDYGNVGNLKQQNPDNMVIDRAYFDFDVSNPKIKQIKNDLIELQKVNLYYRKDKQAGLKKELQDLIINEHIAEVAINEAKDFTKKFKVRFGREPILFFSGCKGAHAYTFFEPIQQVDINRTLSWFAEDIKKKLNYRTLDLAVNKDAKTRLSRIPYSKHQYSLLSVVPFSIEDSYDTIMEKALNPIIGPFIREKHLSSFGSYLIELDNILKDNEKIENEIKESKRLVNPIKPSGCKISDHREWFKQIIRGPSKEYEHYDMYNCPFNDHEDHKPSFMVHKTGYKCKGCGRRGNYWQFLKDYYGWSDDQVKTHLKNKVLITCR